MRADQRGAPERPCRSRSPPWSRMRQGRAPLTTGRTGRLIERSQGVPGEILRNHVPCSDGQAPKDAPEMHNPARILRGPRRTRAGRPQRRPAMSGKRQSAPLLPRRRN